ncbi:MexH family multidrug efflux RND transporter periplasmic adaptor subunit [Alsobacter metallidurans]|uniref:MexH family multidrug efflux RND transporter periplasmic adaptor subunit n=1 Tax=Alsobacter metallidurans TaxID=340221 RepID=A0A917MG60_9HYPH|nr:efflux RND transporter periplasmic adaptor subunit [Alsobacter metallidurans]GGH08943.1 MexH family multidrug efflux RND transporter periplasmic adaptor subunit [Alsobacter metallidurans]
MKRRIVVALVFLLAVGLCGGLVWFNFFRDKMITQFFATMQRPAQTVSAADATATTWTPGILAIGSARAEQGVELAVETGGVVKDIRFSANQHFNKGDLVVQLDDAVERADLADAQAAVKLAESNLERSSTLRQRGFDTQAAYDQVVAQLATARARLQRIQAVIEQKGLKAPFGGTIGIPRINPGQYLQTGSVVATYQNLQAMKVDFTVPEQLIAKVKVGQTVRFGVTENDLSKNGKVIGIDPRVDPQTRLVSVQALLDDNRDESVIPGQFLRVRVDLPAEPNVVSVPQTAVIASLYGDYVFTIEEQKDGDKSKLVVKQVFVKAGRREGKMVEVVSGIPAGQKVVASGQNKLTAGATVKIDNTIDITKLASGG